MSNSCDKAKRKARWLRYAVVAAMVVIVLVNVLLAWRGITFNPDAGSLLQIYVSSQLDGHPRLALLESALLSLIYLYGLYRVVRLMRLFEQGDFFSTAAARHLRAFALSLLVGTIADCLLPPVELIVARVAGAIQLHAVSVKLDSSDVWMILISGMFFVIAWIMGEARQLAEDNQLII
jgi:hypothetical protein